MPKYHNIVQFNAFYTAIAYQLLVFGDRFSSLLQRDGISTNITSRILDSTLYLRPGIPVVAVASFAECHDQGGRRTHTLCLVDIAQLVCRKVTTARKIGGIAFVQDTIASIDVVE
ncbi:hypothetical protein [Anabaena sp. UHCC 0204]|uniref:hypothetical protein n=1 Tax=Anabaena sp. UHCC 0204 TaxID=2590009 RepID=UPI00144789CC|nr:hypothetical protein [Anabaena sp. UHCC 0204]MTJ08068.1 hypothetical protein [Anabaena sp. UHCC 0204]